MLKSSSQGGTDFSPCFSPCFPSVTLWSRAAPLSCSCGSLHPREFIGNLRNPSFLTSLNHQSPYSSGVLISWRVVQTSGYQHLYLKQSVLAVFNLCTNMQVTKRAENCFFFVVVVLAPECKNSIMCCRCRLTWKSKQLYHSDFSLTPN